MPAKRIIVLDNPNGGSTYHVALWADVPVARQPFYASPGAVSAWTGASAADNAAIATGAVAEKVISYDTATAETLNQLKAVLIAGWTLWQAHITNDNAWARYGTFFDGTTWTAGGVA